jgi:hypothetical protein
MKEVRTDCCDPKASRQSAAAAHLAASSRTDHDLGEFHFFRLST